MNAPHLVAADGQAGDAVVALIVGLGELLRHELATAVLVGIAQRLDVYVRKRVAVLIHHAAGHHRRGREVKDQALYRLSGGERQHRGRVAEAPRAGLEAALEASAALPRRAWLNLNASPGLVIAGEPLKSILSGSKRRLVLEVTEDLVMADPERVIDVVDGLHALGIAIALDDFGAGRSSLAYVRRLQVAELKLDKRFMMTVDVDDDARAIVRGAVELAHELGLRVVAEGVETPSAWRMLRATGCEEAQGYLVSRPVPASGIDLMMRAPTTPPDAVLAT